MRKLEKFELSEPSGGVLPLLIGAAILVMVKGCKDEHNADAKVDKAKNLEG
ncbi:hypothetical protein [uncultured Pseudoteredinibacter sp.]|uniref:hypothetical protein n=1 Tax=uncultured Pseudoteredinibacter sp. TaxID=1641701 RepID=UPI0026284EE5|nr:hypothetical protein [uncultured Pseudoteredinibacter sp.]